MRDIFDSSGLAIEFSKATRVCERVQGQVVGLRKDFINENVGRDSKIDQSESRNSELSLT